MKAKDFTIIEKRLLPLLPGFVIKGKLMLIPPVGDFLRGIYFEGSSGLRDFYVRVMYLPLFLPHEEINFIHGRRLRWNKREGWNADDPELIEKLIDSIRQDAIPFLESVSTLAGVLQVVEWDVKSDWPKFNSHHLEELAYVQIKLGDYPAALESLTHLERSLEDSTTAWIVNQRSRASLIKAKLMQSPESALAQLEEWRNWTIAHLGLEKFQ